MTEINKRNLEAVLVSMMTVAKNMELYPGEHPSVQNPLDQTFGLLSDILRMKGVPVGKRDFMGRIRIAS